MVLIVTSILQLTVLYLRCRTVFFEYSTKCHILPKTKSLFGLVAEGTFKRKALHDFVSANKLPLVIHYKKETASLFFDNAIQKQVRRLFCFPEILGKCLGTCFFEAVCLVNFSTFLLYWVVYFRSSALSGMMNTGVMLNPFLKKLRGLSEARCGSLTNWFAQVCNSILPFIFFPLSPSQGGRLSNTLIQKYRRIGSPMTMRCSSMLDSSFQRLNFSSPMYL